jgi:hypothetical protein
MTNDFLYKYMFVVRIYIRLPDCYKLVSFSRDTELCTSRTLLFRFVNPQNRALCASRSSQLSAPLVIEALCILVL